MLVCPPAQCILQGYCQVPGFNIVFRCQRKVFIVIYFLQDENGHLLVTEYGLCSYKDHQTLSMQEVPENSAPGQLPRTVDVIVEDDLVDSCKPGDRVAIVGIYKALPGKSKGSVNGVFR